MSQRPDFDLYEELQVSRNAGTEVIEAAHRSLAKKHHPDVAGTDPGALERTKRLNIARDWLTDPTLRAIYDQGSPSPAASRPRRAASAPTPGPRPSGPASAGGSRGDRFGPMTAGVEAFIEEVRGAREPSSAALMQAQILMATASFREALVVLQRATRNCPDWATDAREAAVAALPPDLRATMSVAVTVAAQALVVGQVLPPRTVGILTLPWRTMAAGRAGPVRPPWAAPRPAPRGPSPESSLADLRRVASKVLLAVVVIALAVGATLAGIAAVLAGMLVVLMIVVLVLAPRRARPRGR